MDCRLICSFRAYILINLITSYENDLIILHQHIFLKSGEIKENQQISDDLYQTSGDFSIIWSNLVQNHYNYGI